MRRTMQDLTEHWRQHGKATVSEDVLLRMCEIMDAAQKRIEVRPQCLLCSVCARVHL